MEYFASAPAALAAGYRPCLRCRPEFEPKVLQDSGDLGPALELIEEGALDEDGSVTSLAASVGIGERRLRRMFQRELGTSPVRLAQTRRLLLARQLLGNSGTPIIDVAYASGFSSLRRFNEAFRNAFGSTPSEFRDSAVDPSAQPAGGVEREHRDTLVLRLGVLTPYDAPFLMNYLRARAIEGVERVVPARTCGAEEGPDMLEDCDDWIYERTFAERDVEGRMQVAFEPALHSPRAVVQGGTGAGATLRVGLSFTERSERLPNLMELVGRVRRLFATQDDPSMLGVFAEDRVLARLAARFPGTRFAGCFDPFEVGVRVILGQQVTVAGASTLTGRVVRRWGRPLREKGHAATNPAETGLPDRLFPEPEVLLDAELEGIGLPGKRAQTVREFARLFVREPGLFDSGQDPIRVRRSLLDLPGVGDWTATLIAMRAMRWRDGFPAGDLVLRKNYAVAAGTAVPSERELREVAQPWSPVRTLAAALLWRAA